MGMTNTFFTIYNIGNDMVKRFFFGNGGTNLHIVVIRGYVPLGAGFYTRY